MDSLYDLKAIEVPGEFSYQVEIVDDKMIDKLKKYNISGFMLAGRLMGLGKSKLKNLEKEENDFAIQDFNCNCSLVFRFSNGAIKLISIAEIVKEGNRDVEKIMV